MSLRRSLVAPVAVMVAAALGCAGPKTSVTQTWSAQEARARPPMKSVLVLAANMDRTSRRAFEDAFVDRLGENGVLAQPSYELFPDTLPDRDAARTATERTNVDGILVVTNLGREQRSTQVPGSYTTGDFWTGYYGGPTGIGAYNPGYAVTAEIAKLETTLWDARETGGRLVWSGSTQTSEPAPGGAFTRSVVDEVVPEIAEAGIIPRAP